MATSPTPAAPNPGRATELKAFDDTKTGVKGLVDRGITEVPRIFINPQNDIDEERTPTTNSQLKFPLIDLKGIDEDPVRRDEVIDEVREASGSWGFFQVVNHGIPGPVLAEMLNCTRKFFEQDDEEKKKWYTRDEKRRFVYNSNFDLFNAPAANWRDTGYCQMAPEFPEPEELPPLCRDIMVEYTKQVLKLGSSLYKILSEALGLKASHLEDMKCGEGLFLILHYYPACPQPHLTVGVNQHADSDFLTVLLNDEINGLQVFHQNQWVDVPSVPGSLVVNVGDLLQIVSNDKFISAQHRVLVNTLSPRISIACFFRSDFTSTEVYKPIEELVSEDSPPKYRPTAVRDYVTYYNRKGLDGTSALSNFRI